MHGYPLKSLHARPFACSLIGLALALIIGNLPNELPSAGLKVEPGTRVPASLAAGERGETTSPNPAAERAADPPTRTEAWRTEAWRTVAWRTGAGLSETRDDQAAIERGRQIYQAQCADCHGPQGEGVEGAYDQPLVGDDSVGQLARLIEETMPEGSPEDCQGPEAQAVAAFIHYSFYSEAAQVRNRPPRIGLARLTAQQLRQSYGDLYAALANGLMWAKPERGVQGVYFNSDGWRAEEKKFERVDPTIDFDFGHNGPSDEIQGNKFYIHWSGGLKVDQTGEYEIVVHGSTSFMLHLGRDGRIFFDNHVQSGDRSEFRRSIHLTGGRVYPFKLELRKRERTTESPPARIQLAWVPPGASQEAVIPEWNLIPGWTPPNFALQTPLPPDDRSYGYERGIDISAQWDQATTAAALEFADVAFEELWPEFLKKHLEQHPDQADSRQPLSDFLAAVIARAWRGGPLTDQERQRYVDRPLQASEDDAEVIKRALLLALKSPYFLYPATADLRAQPSRRVANRLAMILYDSLTIDEPLEELAGRQELSDDDIRGYVWGRWNDFRLQAKLLSLLHQWLHLEHGLDSSKSSELFPGFDRELVADLRVSMDLMLMDYLADPQGDLRSLLRDTRVYTTARLEDFYGESWAADPEQPQVKGRFRQSIPNSEHRFGVLTHPYLTSRLAYHNASSPIHRGVFLYRYTLGRSLRPPQEDFSPLSPDLHPDLTTRARVELQTSPESCQVCHQKINALGFVLEHYDAVGRLRSEERGQPIDVSGGYVDRQGQAVSFRGVADLAEYLAESPDARRAFVNRAFQHFVQQPPAAYGPEVLDQLSQKFADSDYKLTALLAEIAVIAAKESAPQP